MRGRMPNLPPVRTRAKTAGTPANECALLKAREMIVTASPTGHPPALPRMITMCPRRTGDGDTVSDTAERAATAPVAHTIAARNAAVTAGRGFIFGRAYSVRYNT